MTTVSATMSSSVWCTSAHSRGSAGPEVDVPLTAGQRVERYRHPSLRALGPHDVEIGADGHHRVLVDRVGDHRGQRPGDGRAQPWAVRAIEHLDDRRRTLVTPATRRD